MRDIIDVDDSISLHLGTSEYVNAFFDLVDRNRAFFKTMMSWVNDFTSIEDAKRSIDAWTIGYAENKKLCYFIEESHKVIGFVCFRSIDMASKEAELGYMMDSAFSGKGILHKCARVLLEVGFSEYNLERVNAVTSTNNLRSKNVALRLSFQEHEIIPGGIVIDNISLDRLTLLLSRQNYEETFTKKQEQTSNHNNNVN